jgi:hypothetical protein
MKESSVSVLILIVLALFVSRSGAQASSQIVGDNPVLTIVIYDYAYVPERHLGAAKWEASRVFHNAGVETRWVDCSNKPGLVADELCLHPPEDVGLVIKILPRELGIPLHYNKDAFGAAVIFPEGNGVPVGYIFSDRVKAKSGDSGFQAVLMGEIMAHELGHLLLGPGSHSATGVMSAVWRDEELLDASHGVLLFTQTQSEKIRVKLALRNRRELAVFSYPRPEQ